MTESCEKTDVVLKMRNSWSILMMIPGVLHFIAAHTLSIASTKWYICQHVYKPI